MAKKKAIKKKAVSKKKAATKKKAPVAAASSDLKEIGLFFGAGAEISYGLPSGGQFAIEIFRRSPTAQKARFKELLQNLSLRTQYAANFLPHDFQKKNINVFGKPDFTSLLQSSLEYRREQVLKFLNNFDENVESAMSARDIDPDILETAYEDYFEEEFGSTNYLQEIQLNEKLGNEVELFGSKYFSVFLDVLADNSQADLLRRCTTSFLQLLVGCCGQKLASDLNDQIFTDAPDDIPIFDDVGGIFQIEFSQAGLSALEIVLGTKTEHFDENSPLDTIAGQICRATLEKLFESCLDYQALIDSHFRYLYEPKASWAKFTKICIFLNVVRDYILEGMPEHADIQARDGYYHDLEVLEDNGLSCDTVGTTNYNEMIQVVCGGTAPEVFHLNGSVTDFYDPYLNQIEQIADPADEYTSQPHILVPLLFTQSGIKPLTSVEMSRRYVSLYDRYAVLDAIVVVGFAFNGDDGHINGLFRQLIQEEQKQVVICHYTRDEFIESKVRKEYQKNLRLEYDPDNLHIIPVDDDRQTDEGELWYKAISQLID